MPSEITKLFLGLSYFKGIGPKWLLKYGKELCYYDFSINAITEISNKFKFKNVNEHSINLAYNFVIEQIDQAHENKSSIISYLDPVFPKYLFLSIYNPAILFIKGNSKALSERSVCIVGTRKPTEHGRIIASRISKYLYQ